MEVHMIGATISHCRILEKLGEGEKEIRLGVQTLCHVGRSASDAGVPILVQ
ncbi:MAG: hypothetical protein HW389_2516 [Bacteroidetes bacterium]|nr:hypothetical protein [Bacteroidota bacterium]